MPVRASYWYMESMRSTHIIPKGISILIPTKKNRDGWTWTWGGKCIYKIHLRVGRRGSKC